MPSPFPGMDPYLEDPAHWRDVHAMFIAAIRTGLTRLLPRAYFARIDERLYVVQSNRAISPDIVVGKGTRARASRKRDNGAVATVASDPAWEVRLETEEVREAFIEIRSKKAHDKLVAAIEVLSPTNKTAGSEGRQDYQTKQEELLASSAHLLEIDLLRRGEHAVAAPLDKVAERGPFDYIVSLSRAGQRDCFEVWTRTVREHLPKVRIPLSEDDPDVVLDLQAIFDRVYDDGDYENMVDYRIPPAVALSPADAKWANALLREKGLRPK